MALTDESGNNGMVMPVSPMYGGGNNNGDFFGGNGAWLILFLLLAMNGGWGYGFGGGMGGFAADGAALYPWMNQTETVNSGFQNQALGYQISGLRSDVTGGFADTALGIAGINQNICQTGGNIVNAMNSGFAGTTAAVTGAQNALAQQMYSNQIADLERSFAAQTANTQGLSALQSQLAQCCCDNRLATCQTQNVIQSEGNATRFADANNTRDIIASQTQSTQAILDKLCALELDGVKAQLAQAQRENVGLQNQLNMATMQASQTAQTAQILAGQAAEIDGVYNRLKNCPVGTYPVCNPLTSPYAQGCGCGA